MMTPPTQVAGPACGPAMLITQSVVWLTPSPPPPPPASGLALVHVMKIRHGVLLLPTIVPPLGVAAPLWVLLMLVLKTWHPGARTSSPSPLERLGWRDSRGALRHHADEFPSPLTSFPESALSSTT